MNLEFFEEGPALVIEGETRHLVVADLHFGIEADLAAHGMHFRNRSAARLKRLMAVIDTAQPDDLILLGDIKHSIPSLTRWEYYEMPGILADIRSGSRSLYSRATTISASSVFSTTGSSSRRKGR